MKVKFLLVLLLLALPCVAFARKLTPEVEHAMAYGAEAKICLKVCDDTGAPVSDASVCAGFDMLPKPHSVYGKTDTNGVCVVKGKTNGNKIVFFVGKDGYYGSSKNITFIKMGEEHGVEDGMWQPYGAYEFIQLRKKRNPQKLIRNEVFLEIPTTNDWIGVDLEKKCFVKPYGDGTVVDLEIRAEWDGLPPWKSGFCQGEMRFPGAFSGGYYADDVRESQNKYPYCANEDADFAEKDVCIVNRNGAPPNLLSTRVPFRVESSIVIRTRCVLDENGMLKRANYGRITDFSIDPGKGTATLALFYVFNPTPNDTNLEDIETAERSRQFIRLCEPPSPKKKKR